MTKLTTEDTELINTLVTERNLKRGAFRNFQSPIIKYLEFHKNKYTMTQLIQEALTEQEKGINPHKTKLYQYLTEFRLYLNDCIGPKTLQTYMIKVGGVYRHYDVIVPKLKPFKLREQSPVTYEDLPSKQELQKALEISTIDMRALLLFQSSSGSSLHESRTITVDMFFKACKEYLENSDNKSIRLVLHQMKQQENIVPVFYLERVKTNKYYYTCCSPEATKEIIKYLLFRIEDTGEDLTLDSKVFPHPKNTYTHKYYYLNQELDLGFVGKYSKLRSHALRKFHASNLGAPVELIDELQGRGKKTIHEAYIKDRPQKIKSEYMRYMYNVMIYDEDDKTTEVSDKQIVPVYEEKQKQQTKHNQQTYYTDIYKDIGKLELKIEQLEARIKQLEGGI